MGGPCYLYICYWGVYATRLLFTNNTTAIATAIRAWCAEQSPDYSGPKPSTLAELGFMPGDCSGTYFSDTDFTVINVAAVSPTQFTITCTPTDQPDRPENPVSVTMTADENGNVTWTQTP